MFRGSSLHTLDAKGRIIIPTRFRPVLALSYGDALVVTRLDGGLRVYTQEEWRKVEDRVFAVEKTNTAMRRFRRVFIGGAETCKVDKQTRMLIPPIMREYAGLDGGIALIGLGPYFEIWSAEKYDAEIRQFDADVASEEFGNEIALIGI